MGAVAELVLVDNGAFGWDIGVVVMVVVAYCWAAVALAGVVGNWDCPGSNLGPP